MTDYQELKDLAEAAQDKQLGTLTIPVSVVLSMIAEIVTMDAEIDRLRNHIKHIGNDALRTQNQALVEFVEYIRRTGDTRLASMAVAALAQPEGGNL